MRCRPGLRTNSLTVAGAALAACLALRPGAGRAAAVALTETGSTLMLPLLQSWADGYGRLSGVHLATAGTGSGAGIAAAEDGTVQLGASDAYMSDMEVRANPGILNIPLAISAQVVAYNLAGLSASLRLSGPVLAGIYAGAIRDWSDPAIAALNPGVALPQHAIVPIRRADASGDTFLFTQFLTFSTPQWEDGPGYGVTVAWPPAAGGLTATGNAGMVQVLSQTPYGVAYVGASLEDALTHAGLGTAPLQNEAGRFVLPTPVAIEAAAAALTPRTPADQRLTLAFAPGEDAYPLINYEYAVVRSQQPDPTRAATLRNFLLWSISPGQGTVAGYLDPVHFVALPTAIRALSELQIARIH
ncbi:MAG: phosphate ABC transporter substrate-binding protein PstS [Janthinobacterium lividum]